MSRYLFLLIIMGMLLAGCGSQVEDDRVNVDHRVGSDSLGDNIITRPFKYAISALLGQGIEITEVNDTLTPEGFLDVQMKGVNKAYGVKQFEYRTEWLDANGMVIPTKTSVWVPVSAMGKSEVTFRFIAPRKEAVDFRLNMRKKKN
ncbi:MAG: DUF1425 domain-containing protein [Planctomycetota bacterium]